MAVVETLVHLRQPPLGFGSRSRNSFSPGSEPYTVRSGEGWGTGLRPKQSDVWRGESVPTFGQELPADSNPNVPPHESRYYYGCEVTARTGLIDFTPLLIGRYGFRTPTPAPSLQASIRIILPGPATRMYSLSAHVGYDVEAFGDRTGTIPPAEQNFPALFLVRYLNQAATLASIEPSWFVNIPLGGGEAFAIGTVGQYRHPNQTFDRIELNGYLGLWIEYIQCSLYLEGVWEVRQQAAGPIVCDGEFHTPPYRPDLLVRIE